MRLTNTLTRSQLEAMIAAIDAADEMAKASSSFAIFVQPHVMAFDESINDQLGYANGCGEFILYREPEILTEQK